MANENRLILLKIKKEHNLTNKKISELSKLSPTTINDFLNEETDNNFQNLGCIGYSKLKDFFKLYGYNLDLNNVDFKKTYGHGICDIAGIENGKQMKYYETWKGMLRRCYSNLWHEREPIYKHCEVCNEWLLFSNFKKWYDENYYEIDGEIMHLDKDIIHKGNKIYNPKSCVFVNRVINNLFTKSDAIRGDLPIGVKRTNNGKYKVQLSFYNFEKGKKDKKSLGHYSTIAEAFEVYKKAKEDNIKRIANHYKDQIPLKLYNAMCNWEVDISD